MKFLRPTCSFTVGHCCWWSWWWSGRGSGCLRVSIHKKGTIITRDMSTWGYALHVQQRDHIQHYRTSQLHATSLFTYTHHHTDTHTHTACPHPPYTHFPVPLTQDGCRVWLPAVALNKTTHSYTQTQGLCQLKPCTAQPRSHSARVVGPVWR